MKRVLSSAASRVGVALRWFVTMEPARLRALWMAVVALLAALGVGVSTGMSDHVLALIGFLSVVVPLVQGEWTRSKVTPTVVAQNTVENVKNAGNTDAGAAA